MFLENNDSTPPRSSRPRGWHCNWRRFLVPEVRMPLPTMKEPMFPALTDKLIFFTHKYIPGASNFIDGKIPKSIIALASPLLTPRVKDATPIAIARTPSETIPFNLANDAEVAVVNPAIDIERPQSLQTDDVNRTPVSLSPMPRMNSSDSTISRRMSIAVSVSGSRLSRLVQLILIAVFSMAIFISLYYNGYAARTSHGRPQTFAANDTFWQGKAMDMNVAKKCGMDGLQCRPFTTLETWIGGQCFGNLIVTSGYVPFVNGGSNGFYTADSDICFSAYHSGVIDATNGGCFEVRLAGPQDYYYGSNANGISSNDFGWFPRSMQFRSVPQSNCQNEEWVSTFLVSLGFFVFPLIYRIEPMWMNHLAAQWGFWYAGLLHFKANGDFWIVLNQLTVKEITLIPMCLFLFHFFGRPGFCPDPRRFPMEAVLFFTVFFWVFIHLDDFASPATAHLNFTASSFAQLDRDAIILLGVLFAIALPLTILQTRIIYRAGLLPAYLIFGGCISFCVLLLNFASDPGTLEFHFHHYFFGLILCVCGRGQRKYSIMIQAIGLALFVQGLAVYDLAPLFNQMNNPPVGYDYDPTGLGFAEIDQDPILTRVQFDLDSDPLNPVVQIEWILPSDIVNNFTCDLETALLIPGIVVVTNAAAASAQASPVWTRMSLDQATPQSASSSNDTSYFSESGMNSTSSNDTRSVGLVIDASVLLPPDLGPLTTQTALFPFVAARNGILFPHVYYGGAINETVSITPNSTLFTTSNPVVFRLALFGDGQSWPVPVPWPFANGTKYHEPNDTFCDRIKGIYSKLTLLQTDPVLASQAWWLN